jgi:hypothetical protein
MIVASRIDAVTVYHAGARVSRVVELSADGGLPSEVEITELPLSLVDAMVRVRVQTVEPAAARVWTGDVRVGLHASERSDGGDASERESLESRERELLRKQQQLAQLELERGYLSVMEVPERSRGEEGKPPPASPVSARVVLEQFVDDAVGERFDAARTLRREIDALEQQIAELRERLQRASSAREVKPHQLRKTVIVKLFTDDEREPPTKVVLALDYHIPGARWAPAYQVKLSRDCLQTELLLRALVAQHSGEDWRGVKLSLSTAAPLSWTELPELTSIRIGRAQPPPPNKRGFRPPPRGATALFADHDRDRHSCRALLPTVQPWRAPHLTPLPPAPVPDPEVAEAGLLHRGAIAVAGAAPEMLDVLEADELEEEALAADAFTGEMEPMPRSSPAPAGPAPQAAPPAPRSPRAMAKRARRRHPSAQLTREVAALADEGPGHEAGASSLLFSQLRLGRADDHGSRNRLLPVDTRAVYLETLGRGAAEAVEVHVDVVNVVNRAQQAAADVGAQPLPEGAADVRRAAGTFDYAYLADAPVDVESDGGFHSVALGTRAAESDVTYVVVPREDAAAYRLAQLKNPLDAPLLPGPVEVHVGGEYVLTSTLPLVGPRGELSLGLGVEQALKVARNTSFTEQRSGTKVVAMTELHHEITIELQNHLARSARCEVRERIPQADENAEVVVEEVNVEPGWELYDQSERQRELLGGRRWRVEIDAGGKQTLRASYVVKIYANNELVGGNRREA